MVDIIAYIREINVGTEEKPERKRFMFLRDTVGDRFLAKSRYRFIEPRIELDYNKLVDAIYDAIDKEIQYSGGEATDLENPYTTRTFDDLIEEAKELWTKLVAADKTSMAQEILQKEFGRPIKFSEILPDQIEQLKSVLYEIRDIL